MWNLFIDNHLREISPEVHLYSQCGFEFRVHKDVFSQTTKMSDILRLAVNAGDKIEIMINTLKKEDLKCVVHYLYYGEVLENDKNQTTYKNLARVFGFPEFEPSAREETLNNGPSTSGVEKMAQKKSSKTSKAGAEKRVCNECGKPFQNANNLEIHVNAVHLKLKQYKCEKCSYASGHPSNLICHVKREHEGIRYQCDLCSHNSGYKHLVTQHIKTKHLL